MMDALTLDVFIAENIVSAYIRGKGLSPTRDSISKHLKKQIQADYTVLQDWSRTFRKEIFNLLDRQHPTRIVTPEIALMMKTGHRFTDLLDGEVETEDSGGGDDTMSDNDVTVIYDPLANDSLQDDEVSPEITRLLDQYEESADDENTLAPCTEPIKRKSRAKACGYLKK